MSKKQDKAWKELGDFVVSNGAEEELDTNLDSHPHSLFIELNDGEYCGTWVFPTVDRILSVIGMDEFRYFLTQFDDTGYLISIHTRDDAEDMG